MKRERLDNFDVYCWESIAAAHQQIGDELQVQRPHWGLILDWAQLIVGYSNKLAISEIHRDWKAMLEGKK